MPDNTVERQHQQSMYLPDGNVLPSPPAARLQGAAPGALGGVPVLGGAPEFTWRTPASPPGLSDFAWLDFPAFWPRKQGRGHTLGVPTLTYTKCPWSLLANQGTRMRPAIPSLRASPKPSQAAQLLALFCPIRASITQSSVYQIEIGYFLRVWHTLGSDRERDKHRSASGEFTARLSRSI